MQPLDQQHPHKRRLTRCHHIQQIIGNPSQPIQTRNSSEDYCFYNSFPGKVEPANVKSALADHDWIVVIKKEINQSTCHDVW